MTKRPPHPAHSRHLLPRGEKAKTLRKFQRRVGEEVVDAEGKGAQGVDLEAVFIDAMDQHRGVVDAGHGEHAGFENGGMKIERNDFSQNITGGRTFDEYPGAAVG